MKNKNQSVSNLKRGLSILSLVCMLPVSPVLANSFMDTYGGAGGVPTEEFCEVGYLTGMVGRSANEIDSIGTICGDLFRAGDEDWVGSLRGGNGGRSFKSSCPEGYVVTGLHGRAGNRIDQLRLVCGQTNSLDRRWLSNSILGGRGGSFFETYCPPSEAAIGFRLRYASRVDSIGLICDDVDSRRR